MQTMRKRALSPVYWDAVIAERRRPSLDAWYAYMRRVYTRLIDAWIPCAGLGGGLKTDLFEEAITQYSLLPHMGVDSLGIDCSVAVVRAAQARLQARGRHCLLVVGDLRQLPIRSASLQYVLSGSSLDHFSCQDEIAICLGELHRVLVAGGTAVFTFDNPHNPIVWLRNRLPFTWLKRIGLLPYYVGATYTREEAHHELETAGFEVMAMTAVVHAPRVIAIWLIALLECLGWVCPWPADTIAGMLDIFEILQYWPTRYRTGYYIACYTRKQRDVQQTGS
jgi:SAM-dependent methyltransferase